MGIADDPIDSTPLPANIRLARISVLIVHGIPDSQTYCSYGPVFWIPHFPVAGYIRMEKRHFSSSPNGHAISY